MSYRVSQLVRACKGQLLNRSEGDQTISTLLIDSRQLRLPEQSIFFALKGYRQDGHHFISDLYQNGVRAFVVSRQIDILPYGDANIIMVEDVLMALQDIAQMHRSHFEIPIIGITGSNGKTVVKEWLHQLLGDDIHLTKNPKSYNSQVGVPLSIWLLSASSDMGVFEAGISRPGEMSKLAQMIAPTIGIFTNIGTAHDEGFRSRAEKIEEKLELFKQVKHLIYCLDHHQLKEAIGRLNCHTFCWSRQDPTADVYIKDIQINGPLSNIHFLFRGKENSITLPFTDTAARENALHCLSTLLLLELAQNRTLQRFGKLQAIQMRLEVREGIHGATIINDTYNADMESFGIALAFANRHAQQRNKTLVISDFEQQTSTDDNLQKHLAALIERTGFSRVFGIGARVPGLRNYLPPDIGLICYPTTRDMLDHISEYDFSNQVVLLKGARSHQLEQIASYLTRQKHNAVLEINLAALARNLKVFESKIRPDTKIMVMVKADAYGSGSLEVVRFLQSRNIDYLGVAYADEGVELRNQNCHLPIMVLNPEEDSIPLLTEYYLEPEVYSLIQLHQIISHLKRTGGTIPVHIKIETGMNRLGFAKSELKALSEVLQAHPEIQVRSIFSHLATSDDESQHSFALQQIRQFERMADLLAKRTNTSPLRHILNSSGIHYFPEAQFDMVRLGIGLYGIGMPDTIALEKVHTLRTRISQLHEIGAGESVGYGRKEIADKPMRIATVGVGYADGLIRKAGNRRYALVIDKRQAPIVGNICMDMTMLDVSGIKDVAVGKTVTVFGPDQAIEKLAKAADTIPYEILTSLSARIKRIYVND